MAARIIYEFGLSLQADRFSRPFILWPEIRITQIPRSKEYGLFLVFSPTHKHAFSIGLFFQITTI